MYLILFYVQNDFDFKFPYLLATLIKVETYYIRINTIYLSLLYYVFIKSTRMRIIFYYVQNSFMQFSSKFNRTIYSVVHYTFT